MDFTGKVVLVTGASSGIGAATAVVFSKLGAKLALTARNEPKLREVARACAFFSNVEPLIVVADLTREEDIKNIVSLTVRQFLKIDVLVNNAGILRMGSLVDTTMEVYDKIFETNVRSVFQLTSLCVPYLILSKGAIVNVSSINGLRSFPGLIAYNMSKAAIDQFTRTLALELASKSVRVNSVNPGVIMTELHKNAGLDEEQYKSFLEHCKTTHALGRAGKSDEVATAIAFLASSNASFITGVNLTVDGGRHLMCPR